VSYFVANPSHLFDGLDCIQHTVRSFSKLVEGVLKAVCAQALSQIAGRRPNEVRRSHHSQGPGWLILNLGMFFSTERNVRINLCAMVWSISVCLRL
jgi:hypothetical protein